MIGCSEASHAILNIYPVTTVPSNSNNINQINNPHID